MTTNFPNGLEVYGVPVFGGNFVTQGNVYFVCPRTGSDANPGNTVDAPFASLTAALAAATANQNDVVYLMAQGNTAANTTNYVSAAFDWNKDGVHLIGVNSAPQIGQRSRVGQLSTVKTIENMFTVSANNCIIANIEFFQGVATSTATSPVAVTISGQRNHVINCQISGNGDTGGSMDTAGARSLVVSGSENLVENCYIGLDTVIRATQAAEVALSGSPTRNIFRNCFFNTYTSASGFLMVTVAATMDRFTLFDNCIFNNVLNISSATTATAVFGGSTSSINGTILLRTPTASGFTNYTAADASRVQALGQNGLATGHLIGITQGIDVT